MILKFIKNYADNKKYSLHQHQLTTRTNLTKNTSQLLVKHKTISNIFKKKSCKSMVYRIFCLNKITIYSIKNTVNPLAP